ncbi:MAG: ABC transporter ATP-binding protein [Bdellovibrionota bacterium]
MDLLKKLSFIFDSRAKRQAIILLFFMFVGAGFETLGVGLIMPYIRIITDPAQIEQNRYVWWLYQNVNAPSQHTFFIWCGIGIMVIYLIKNLYLAALSYFQYKLAFGKAVSLARYLFTTYVFQPYPFFLNRNTALLQRNLDQVGRIIVGVVMPFLVVLTELMVMTCIGALLLMVTPGPAVAALLVLGSSTVAFYYLVRKRVKAWGQKSQFYTAEIAKAVHQAFGGIKETKIWGCEDFFVKAYMENYGGDMKVTRHAQTVGQLPRLFIETISVTGVILLILFMLWQQQSAVSTLPVLILFGLAMLRLMPSVTRIVSSVTMMRYCKSAVDIVYEDLKSLSDFKLPAAVRAQRSEKALKDSIELKSVSYQYPGTHFFALEEVNLTIKRGDSVAFIGPSGAGKTTLVDLVLGLLEPTSGRILVDGANIHQDIRSWQKRIGYIPQSIYLCDDSLRRNIAFGIPDNEIEDARIWDAIRAAQLDEVAAQLGSLDAVVGERGVRLSGGQRQRIGIARALYHNPDLLVLDEATSALDHETELEVIRAIERLSQEKTILVIAHRLTTAKNCKRLYQIVDGRIVAEGTYREVVGAVQA